MYRLLSRKFLANITVSLISLCVALVVAELCLRFVFPSPNKYYVWQPHLRWNFRPSPVVMPGVEGESRFITNSEGIRADEFAPDKTYKILAVGGSTTECLYLDQEEAWPHLLQKRLNEKQGVSNVWVGNIGKSGLNTRDHVVQLRYLLEQNADIDAIILMVGINDLSLRLGQDSDYDPNFLKRFGAEQEILPRAFNNAKDNAAGDKPTPYYKRTAIWRLLKRIKAGDSTTRKAQDDDGKMYISWRERRRNAPRIRQALPDLTSALDEYAENISTIIDLARRKSIRLILVTQPVLWKPNLEKQLNDLLWFGGVGNFLEESGKEYYSVEALSKAMEAYNETLIKTCHARQAECFDLAPLLPKDTTAFYDDVHFNESGARKVAEALTVFLSQNRPLSAK
jgi:lysophospholipase L1-like esterase